MKRLRSECLDCIATKQIKNYPKTATEDEKVSYIKEMFGILNRAEDHDSGPTMVDKINKLQKSLFGMENPYTQLKPYYNNFMEQFVPIIKEKIKNSKHPLKSAIQYAMVGNYIDFGAVPNVEESEIERLINAADGYILPEDTMTALEKDMTNGHSLVFLTDNCGEIVMDRVLLETIKELYPNLNISVIVRGEPVLNDATLDDAEQVGLTKEFNVIGNGTGIAGTCLEKISGQAKSLIDDASLVLSKGQGNFETLRGCGLNIYYIFLCKCEMFANAFGVEKLTGMLVNDKDCLK